MLLELFPAEIYTNGGILSLQRDVELEIVER
jgi:hypothetical protein